MTGITGQMVPQADRTAEALVGAQEVWKEWSGQPVEDTDCRTQEQWEAMYKAVRRTSWACCLKPW